MDWIKDKKKLVSRVLLGAAALLAVLCLVKIVTYFTFAAYAHSTVEGLASMSDPDLKKGEKFLAKRKESGEEFKKINLFCPPPPEQHPVSQVSAIMGKEILINGKWYKAGDSVADAKIVLIEPARVKISWKGEEKWFSPIGAQSVASGGESPKPERNRGERRGMGGRRNRDEVQAADTASSPTAEDPYAWLGVELSESQRNKLNIIWGKMSDAEKENAKEGWSKMSDEQKKGALEEIDKVSEDELRK